MRSLTNRASIAGTILVACFAGAGSAGTISLASIMDADSFIAETQNTGSFARIGLGDGSLGSAGANTGDTDGLFLFPGPPFADEPPTDNLILTGTPVDVFPREQNFEVGELTYDSSGVTASGVETVNVTGLNFDGLWLADPARVDFANFNAPTVISDISDYAIGLWFFNFPGSIEFDTSVTAADTVTFTDGVLTSINVVKDVDFIVDAAGFGSSELVYSGTLEFDGVSISLQIDDANPGFTGGESRVIFDLTGRVTAVVPTPGSALSLAIVGLIATARRRAASEASA